MSQRAGILEQEKEFAATFQIPRYLGHEYRWAKVTRCVRRRRVYSCSKGANIFELNVLVGEGLFTLRDL